MEGPPAAFVFKTSRLGQIPKIVGMWRQGAGMEEKLPPLTYGLKIVATGTSSSRSRSQSSPRSASSRSTFRSTALRPCRHLQTTHTKPKSRPRRQCTVGTQTPSEWITQHSDLAELRSAKQMLEREIRRLEAEKKRHITQLRLELAVSLSVCLSVCLSLSLIPDCLYEGLFTQRCHSWRERTPPFKE